MDTAKINKQLLPLLKKTRVAIFGSYLERGNDANNIDLIVENGQNFKKELRAIAKVIGKHLDVFLTPIREEEFTGKMYITSKGRISFRGAVFCGKDFFAEAKEII